MRAKVLKTSNTFLTTIFQVPKGKMTIIVTIATAFTKAGLSIAWRLTLYFFSLFWGRVFFTFQHNLGAFCRGELKLNLK
jgi:hypothetical protein